MERLWAPWRMEYINGIGKEEGGCIFCAKPAAQEDETNLILYRGRTVFIILNAYPYSNGHLLVAPYRHTGELTELAPEEAQELLAATMLGMRTLREAMRPDGFNVGMNLGRVAGAGIADHLHLHLVPRWGGDTNFMTVCGGAKVIPEALSVTYHKLRQALAAREAGDA